MDQEPYVSILDPFPRNCHYEVSQTILYLLTLCYRQLQIQHDIFRLWNYPLHLWSQMKVFPVKTSKISINVYTLRSSCLNKMSRSQACFQEVLLQTTFTSTDPSASRTASSPSSQDTYNEFWDPKYKNQNIIKNASTIEITDILNITNSKEIFSI